VIAVLANRLELPDGRPPTAAPRPGLVDAEVADDVRDRAPPGLAWKEVPETPLSVTACWWDARSTYRCVAAMVLAILGAAMLILGRQSRRKAGGQGRRIGDQAVVALEPRKLL